MPASHRGGPGSIMAVGHNCDLNGVCNKVQMLFSVEPDESLCLYNEMEHTTEENVASHLNISPRRWLLGSDKQQ